MDTMDENLDLMMVLWQAKNKKLQKKVGDFFWG